MSSKDTVKDTSASSSASLDSFSSVSTILATSYLSSAIVFIPLALLQQQSSLLHPLFSSATTGATSLAFHALIAVLAASSWVLVPALREVGWRQWWVLMGASLVISEGVVRIGAEPFLRLGPVVGLWSARLAVEGVTTLARWGWVFRIVFCEKRLLLRDVFLFVACVSAVTGSSWESSLLASVPECYSLQAYGLLIVTLAIAFPNIAYTANASAPSESLKIVYSSGMPRKSSIKIAAATLVLAYLTSTTTSHCPSSALAPAFPSFSTNSTGYSNILEARKSVTGWIVVGEQDVKGHRMRYMRADHSLLGGLWVGPARKAVIEAMLEAKVSLWAKVNEDEVVGTADSIYSTFILQELVRLVVRPEKKQDRGLMIGLGAGLAARGLHSLGVNLTVVEIDPVVFDFAHRYFAVPDTMGGAVIEDARVFLRRERTEKFDYIIHDVFTGGKVPSALFTQECWKEVKSVLAPQGVVAINYAGNITSRASHLVLSTILSSFAHCRAFEDGPPHSDFRNIIIFCSADTPLVFRKPIDTDYLHYPSPAIRARALETFDRFEIDLRGTDRRAVVVDGKESILDKAQLSEVTEHWVKMKQVLPIETWAQY